MMKSWTNGRTDCACDRSSLAKSRTYKSCEVVEVVMLVEISSPDNTTVHNIHTNEIPLLRNTDKPSQVNIDTPPSIRPLHLQMMNLIHTVWTKSRTWRWTYLHWKFWFNEVCPAIIAMIASQKADYVLAWYDAPSSCSYTTYLTRQHWYVSKQINFLFVLYFASFPFVVSHIFLSHNIHPDEQQYSLCSYRINHVDTHISPWRTDLPQPCPTPPACLWLITANSPATDIMWRSCTFTPTYKEWLSQFRFEVGRQAVRDLTSVAMSLDVVVRGRCRSLKRDQASVHTINCNEQCLFYQLFCLCS